MKGSHHRAVAAALWPAVGTVTHLPTWQVLLTIPVAVAFSSGVTSPDVDNARWWQEIDQWTPDEALGHGGPLGHRELMHWWGIPALTAWIAWVLPLGPLAITVWAAIVGWGSHLAADAVFGRGGRAIRPGIPVLPWGPLRLAVGLMSDGPAAAVLIWPICVGLWWLTLGHPGTGHVIGWASSLH